ncbi:MAG: methyltransferase domain-containing protein [Chloroflexi bacterium]|nr:methyltransferase domain-containing protein [Chloroflexota bacterium]
MASRYTEEDTRAYYDAEDATYRAFWDSEGSLHWGYFDEATGDDFLRACASLDHLMVIKGRIGVTSRVLDVGCGNGTTALWLSRTTGCQITGVDLSSVRVGNATKALEGQPPELRQRVTFQEASATALPYPGESFTHVWSQATIYHIHDKAAALTEVYRVLRGGGAFVFDDLIKPKLEVSAEARRYVYDRLLFDTPYSFASYAQALSNLGFTVVEAIDLSEHLKKSYSILAQRAVIGTRGRADAEKYSYLAHAYHQTVKAIERGELGWGLYVCQK